MDGLKRGRGSSMQRPHARPSSAAQAHSRKKDAEQYFLIRSIGKLASKQKKTVWKRFRQTEFAKWPDKNIWHKVYATVTLVLFVFSTVAGIVQPFLDDKFYGVTPAVRGVLPAKKESLAGYLKYDAKEEGFLYNEGYTGQSNDQVGSIGQGTPRITAAFGKEASKGATVSDPMNQVAFRMIPKFKLNVGKQDGNQLFYPLVGKAGYLVYSTQIASVKEDIVLEEKSENKLEFTYELELGSEMEARLEKNGSVGIYGTSLPVMGNVSTSNEKDAELLEKARKNADKDKLMFVIPAPFIVESGKERSTLPVYYKLEGKMLTVVADNLHEASYPLSIDPSVYVETAVQLMRGNNETNVEFDIATEQFKKGTTTGARIDEWTDTTDMPDTSWDNMVAASGGYVYRAGGRTGSIKPEIMDKMVTTSATAVSTFTMNMPDTRPAGDLYIAIIAHHNSGASVNTPAGWTNYNNANEHSAFYKVGTNVSGGNEAASYNFTLSTGSQQFAGVIIRVRNFSSVVTSTTGSATSGAPTYPAITATTNNSLLIRGSGFDDDIPPESGYSPAGHVDIASGYSNGVTSSTNAVGFTASELYNPPTAGVSTPAAAISGPNDSYGASSLLINGIAGSNTISSSVQWARFNSVNGSVESPTPGSNGVACSGWCTNSVYNLPLNTAATNDGAGHVGGQMIAYNGYLYMIGGYDGTQLKDTIYISKLGVNGEPSLWHPSDPAQSNWTYWYKNPTALSSPRAYHSAYAYNGKMYIYGGRTSMNGASPGATNQVWIADILPNGTLANFTAGPNLPGARYGMAAAGYNGYLYLIGGNSGTTVYNNVYYSRIKADGNLEPWQDAMVPNMSLPEARTSMGGLMTGTWGGYIYLAGGCSALNTTGSGYCTNTRDDVQLASINADGTLDTWNTILDLKNKRFGGSFVAWQDSLYRFGGCGFQSASTGECFDAHRKVQYGNINQDGDASTVSVTTAPGSGLCQGSDPYDCNLPPPGNGASQGGQMLSTTAVLNGYLYNMGGCTNTTCSTVSSNISYTSIDSNGKLKRPATCPYSVYGAWCVDSTTATGGGLAAAPVVAYNGYLYVIGGLTGGGQSNVLFRVIVNEDGSMTGPYVQQTLSSVGMSEYNSNGLSYSYAYVRANPGGTNPANLYIFGGCKRSTGGAGCSENENSASVYKCDIQAAGPISGCTTSGQLQINQSSGASAPGLALHAGTVYANYIYLMGGVSPGIVDMKTVRFAKFDNNNNVVAASGSTWIESNVQMSIGRRRGTALGYNGYVYAVGGFEATISRPLDTIEFAKINVSTGDLESDYYVGGAPTFKQSSVTISQRWGLALTVSNSYAYVLGGCAQGIAPGGCSAFDPTVQTFQLYNNNSGTPGGYSEETNVYSGNRIGGSAAAANGYIYMAGGCAAGAVNCQSPTNSVQYAPLDAYGGVGTWLDTSPLPAARGYGQLEVVGSTVYWIGGQDSSGNAQSNIYYATINSDGTLSAWSTASGSGDPLPEARGMISAAVWNNRIYVTGGYTGSAYRNSVYISADMSGGGGDLNWATSGSTFNTGRSGHTAVTYANNLYIIGGYTGSRFLSDTQYVKINTDGSLGSWNFSTSMPFPVSQGDGFAVNGYMYLFGGRASVNDCTPRTLIAPISANTAISAGNNPTGIGEWYQTNRNFVGGRYGNSAVYFDGKAYVLGGGCQGLVMYDDFNNGIDASQWTTTTSMMAGTTCQSTSTSNVLYTNDSSSSVYAETKGVDMTNGGTLYYRFFSPSSDGGGCYTRDRTFGGLLGLIARPEDLFLQRSVNGGSYTNIATFAWNGAYDPIKNYTYNQPAISGGTNVKYRWIVPEWGGANDSWALDDVYIVANNNTSVMFSSPVSKTTLLSQPQVANYSRMVDAGRDVFPTKWLLNGVDNSIGARWQMTYRSMNDPAAAIPCGSGVMSGFGQATNFGDVTLGSPENYIVRDGSGNDIGCSRYFFMNISIDASRTYGYPDDITRGPTLDNLTLFFKSNPGQRLLHGKTFIEGLQQPLDTQPGNP